ncbi:hypothetical protein GGP93_002998 [Salinibacter ruber]|nr:hypothetical protein [Salinibacter ruber]
MACKINQIGPSGSTEGSSVSLYGHYTKPEKRTRQKAKPQ